MYGRISGRGMEGYPPRVRRELSPEATLDARWLHGPQPISNQWGWGFDTLRGGIDPGDLRFRPRLAGVVNVWKDS